MGCNGEIGMKIEGGLIKPTSITHKVSSIQIILKPINITLTTEKKWDRAGKETQTNEADKKPKRSIQETQTKHTRNPTESIN